MPSAISTIDSEKIISRVKVKSIYEYCKSATGLFEDNMQEQVHVTVAVKWVKDDKRRK